MQLSELNQLLKKEKATRPQESTSPILFHPTTETPFRAPSTTPVSFEYFPDSEGLTFDDITRFYGGGNLPTPFTPADDTKPIVETVTEHPLRPTPPSILISPAAVTVRTPEVRYPQEFHASALVDQPDDKHVSIRVGRRNARKIMRIRELRNIPMRDVRNSFDPLVLQEAFPMVGNRDILMTPLPVEIPDKHERPIANYSTFIARYKECLRRKNNAFLRTINAKIIPARRTPEIPARRKRYAKNITVTFDELSNETLSHLPVKDGKLLDPDGDKFTNDSSSEYLDYWDYDFDENATLSDEYPDFLNTSRRYDYFEVTDEDEDNHEGEILQGEHGHQIEYKLVPVTLYKRVPVIKNRKRPKKMRRPRKRRPRRPRYKKYRKFPKYPFHLLR